MSVVASGGTISRRRLYGASSMGFVGGLLNRQGLPSSARSTTRGASIPRARREGDHGPALEAVAGRAGDREAYERAHVNRAVVLDMLRDLRTIEPLAGYDTLDADQVVEALAGAQR